MEQQQEQTTCLELLKNAESILRESETIASNNLEMLEEDGEKLRHIFRSTGMIETSLDMSVKKIAQMEHPFCSWSRNTKIRRRNADTLSLDCTSENGNAQTWAMKGMLLKRTDWTKKWKTRYCVIDGEVLNYYESMHSKLRGTIVLKGATITEHAYSEYGRDNCFSITQISKRNGILFECPRSNDYMSWITWLRKATGTEPRAPTSTLPNSAASLLASSTSGIGAATRSARDGRCCIGVEEDKVLDGIEHALDNLDRFARTTKKVINDQTHQIQSISCRAAQLDRRVVEYSKRVKEIRV